MPTFCAFPSLHKVKPLWGVMQVTALRIRAKCHSWCLSINGCLESGTDHEQSDIPVVMQLDV